MQQGCDMIKDFILYRINIQHYLAVLLTSMFITLAYHAQNCIVNKIQFF